MTARRVFRLILLVLAIALAARHFGYFGSTDDAPAPSQGRAPVVVQVPPDAIGRAPGAAQTPADAPAPAPAPADAEATRRDLRGDEQRGGHTMARHVGKSDDDLRARLSRERRIPAASTYTDLATAERMVGTTLAQQADRVSRWADRDGKRPNLALDYRGSPGAVIGRSMAQGDDTTSPCYDAVVVLTWDTSTNDYYVLTSYPEVRRGR